MGESVSTGTVIGTAEHLPECAPRISNWGEDCICRYLRACEKRVLQAAQEAVERASSLFQPLGAALAAIDALREERK